MIQQRQNSKAATLCQGDNLNFYMFDSERLAYVSAGAGQNCLAHLWFAVLRGHHDDRDADGELLFFDLLQ